MQIDLVIDVVCPWCYLGKKQLDRALEQSPGSVDLFIRPFQLGPDIGPEGIDRSDYYRRKFGDGPQLAATRDHLARAGEQYGISFDWRDGVTLANTLDAHRLIRWAQGAGKASEMADAIMKAYFTDGAYLGDHELLADIAAAQGMDREIIAGLLASDADTAEVLAAVDQARQMGIQGVPATILAGRALLSGAQEPEVYMKAIAEVEAGLH